MGMLLEFVLAAALCYLISGIRQKEMEKEILESYMNSFQEIYDSIQKRMDLTRKFRHDLLSHIQTLEYLLQRQKDPDGELKKYADRLAQEYQKVEKGRFCKDEITDAFLMMEKQECIKKEIPLQIEVPENCLAWMDPVERIGFLHNILDNAMEANERIPQGEQRGISFAITEDQNSCKVMLKNALAKDEILSAQSRKNDGGEHGVGTTIVHALVKKYHGSEKAFWDKEKHSLQQTFLFPRKRLEEKRKNA